MKHLIVALVPVVASLVAVAAIKNSNKEIDSNKPHNHDGSMPTGDARFGDQDSLDSPMSFWQQEPHRITNYQL